MHAESLWKSNSTLLVVNINFSMAMKILWLLCAFMSIIIIILSVISFRDDAIKFRFLISSIMKLIMLIITWLYLTDTPLRNSAYFNSSLHVITRIILKCVLHACLSIWCWRTICNPLLTRCCYFLIISTYITILPAFFWSNVQNVDRLLTLIQEDLSLILNDCSIIVSSSNCVYYFKSTIQAFFFKVLNPL